MASLRSDFEQLGLVELDDFGSSQMWARLSAEAAECESEAGPRLYRGLAVRRDGSVLSPQRCRSHPGRQHLYEFAHSPELITAARAASGMRSLVTARYGYKYYRPGDFMGLHRDAIQCTVTFSFGLTANLEVMGWEPALRDLSSEELGERIGREGFMPELRHSVHIEMHKLKGFDGHNIPHWRPYFADGLGILGTVCFFAV